MTGTGGGMTACATCGEYLVDETVMAEDLCGFQSLMNDVITCDSADTSCGYLVDLQNCSCASDGFCQALCADNVCAGLTASTECAACIQQASNNDMPPGCAEQFQGCSGDI